MKKQPQSKPELKEAKLEEDPFLKALQKKTKNINKKLIEIAELQLKQDLKPDQIEKVNRKGALQFELNDIEKHSQLYRESKGEISEYNLSTKFFEVENLAKAIVAYKMELKCPQKSKIQVLLNNINERKVVQLQDSKYLFSIMKEILEDSKLMKIINKRFETTEISQIKSQSGKNEEIKIKENIKEIIKPIIVKQEKLQQIKHTEDSKLFPIKDDAKNGQGILKKQYVPKVQMPVQEKVQLKKQNKVKQYEQKNKHQEKIIQHQEKTIKLQVKAQIKPINVIQTKTKKNQIKFQQKIQQNISLKSNISLEAQSLPTAKPETKNQVINKPNKYVQKQESVEQSNNNLPAKKYTQKYVQKQKPKDREYLPRQPNNYDNRKRNRNWAPTYRNNNQENERQRNYEREVDRQLPVFIKKRKYSTRQNLEDSDSSLSQNGILPFKDEQLREMKREGLFKQR